MSTPAQFVYPFVSPFALDLLPFNLGRVDREDAVHAYLAARRGRKDRIELRGDDKLAGGLTGVEWKVTDGVPKLSGTIRLTL